MEIFTTSAFAPFTAALLIVAALCILEIAGLVATGVGLSELAHMMLDTDSFPETAWTNWLIVRGLPLSVAVLLVLGIFGSAGIAIQQAAIALRSETLPVTLVVLGAGVLGWAGLRVAGRALAPLFGTNTTAIHLDTFIGRKAVILSPRCTAGLLAEVQITDAHGAVHSLMVSPASGESDFIAGDEVVLHAPASHGFTVRKA